MLQITKQINNCPLFGVSCFDPAKAQVQKGMAILGLGQKSEVSLPLRQSTSGQNILAGSGSLDRRAMGHARASHGYVQILSKFEDF